MTDDFDKPVRAETAIQRFRRYHAEGGLLEADPDEIQTQLQDLVMELDEINDGVAAERDRLVAAEELLNDLMGVFRNYEENHLAKTPPDFAKAGKNRDHAVRIEKFLYPEQADEFQEDER